jgi:hypothetical protein
MFLQFAVTVKMRLQSFKTSGNYEYSSLYRFWPLTFVGRAQHADHRMKEGRGKEAIKFISFLPFASSLPSSLPVNVKVPTDTFQKPKTLTLPVYTICFNGQ